ncbi:MAG: ABC transporter substrate-binding protein [Candidatus Nanopelagicales bacterium]
MSKFRTLAALGLVVAVALAGCSSGTSSSSSDSTDSGSSSNGSSANNCGATIEEIAANAKEEGMVNLIALPDTWANYAGILASFRDKYGIEAPVQNPDASSADELTAIDTLRGQSGMPEAVDIGPAFNEEMRTKGYSELYKPIVWDEIPDALKDPEGYWVAAYYGVLAIATNTTLVPDAPKTWADLKKPAYKGMVTINGDPREAGAAFAAVFAAALGNGGSFDDIMPGIEYYAELQELGNLQTIDVTPAGILSGEVPIALDWTYNFPGLQPQIAEAGFEFQINVPADGVYGGYYSQSVVTEVEHPCAARLWLEHIVSDDGALGYLEGGAVPARYGSLLERGLVSAELAATLPSADILNAITFPSAAQVEAARAVITENWGPMVADN